MRLSLKDLISCIGYQHQESYLQDLRWVESVVQAGKGELDDENCGELSKDELAAYFTGEWLKREQVMEENAGKIAALKVSKRDLPKYLDLFPFLEGGSKTVFKLK